MARLYQERMMLYIEKFTLIDSKKLSDISRKIGVIQHSEEAGKTYYKWKRGYEKMVKKH